VIRVWFHKEEDGKDFPGATEFSLSGGALVLGNACGNICAFEPGYWFRVERKNKFPHEETDYVVNFRKPVSVG